VRGGARAIRSAHGSRSRARTLRRTSAGPKSSASSPTCGTSVRADYPLQKDRRTASGGRAPAR
jgi:hypothetical protein